MNDCSRRELVSDVKPASCTLVAHCRKMLDKFYIGDLERPVGKVPDSEWARYVEYCDDQSDASFYVTLKRRVEAYFKSNKVSVHVPPLVLELWHWPFW